MMKKVKAGNLRFIIPIILVFLFLFPLWKSDIYYLSFGFILFTYIALACSWNIIGGYAGYLSFGHVAFFGIGAYTTALFLEHFGLSPFYTCLLGGILAAIVAGIFGYPCLRLKGPYFALATLCLALVMPVVASHLELTHTVVGIWMPTLPFSGFTSRAIFYEAMLALMLVIIFACRRIERSKFGLGLSSIREDEDTAQTLGVDTARLKVAAFMLSAFFTGIVGGIYAYYRTYIAPSLVFDVFMSIIIVMMAILGGRQSWIGPVIGASILTIISEVTTAYLAIGVEFSRMIYGLLLVIIIMFLPNGLLPYIRRRHSPQRKEELTAS